MLDIDFFDEDTIQNLGYTQIAEENEMTVEEVKQTIAKFSREDRRYLTRILDKNERKYQARKKRKEENSSKSDDGSKSAVMSDEERIERLGEQRAEVEKKIALHKSNKRNMLNVAATGEQEIKELKERIKQLQDEIEVKESRILEIDEVLASNLKELAETENEISSEQAKADDISAKIRLLKKKKVTVTTAGNVELEDGVTIPENWMEKYAEFLSPGEATEALEATLENLTRREIKTLAKLIAILEMFDNQGQRYEVVFENANIEKAYAIWASKEE